MEVFYDATILSVSHFSFEIKLRREFVSIIKHSKWLFLGFSGPVRLGNKSID